MALNDRRVSETSPVQPGAKVVESGIIGAPLKSNDQRSNSIIEPGSSVIDRQPSIVAISNVELDKHEQIIVDKPFKEVAKEKWNNFCKFFSDIFDNVKNYFKNDNQQEGNHEVVMDKPVKLQRKPSDISGFGQQLGDSVQAVGKLEEDILQDMMDPNKKDKDIPETHMGIHGEQEQQELEHEQRPRILSEGVERNRAFSEGPKEPKQQEKPLQEIIDGLVHQVTGGKTPDPMDKLALVSDISQDIRKPSIHEEVMEHSETPEGTFIIDGNQNLDDHRIVKPQKNPSIQAFHHDENEQFEHQEETPTGIIKEKDYSGTEHDVVVKKGSPKQINLDQIEEDVMKDVLQDHP